MDHVEKPQDLEAFKELFTTNLEKIAVEIAKLPDDASYLESLDELYHLYRELYTSADSVDLPAVSRAMSVAAEAMQILRHRKPPIDHSMIDWLDLFMDFINAWNKQIKADDFNLVPLDSYTLNMIKTTSLATDKVSNILKRLTLLIIDPHEKFAIQMQTFLNKALKKAFIDNPVDNLLKQYDKYKPDFIILDIDVLHYDIGAFMKELRKRRILVPLITLSVISLAEHNFSNVQESLISAHISKPLQTSQLLHTIECLATKFYAKRDLRVIDQKVIEQIKSLKPLDRTVRQIQELSNDEKAGVFEVTNIIRLDPIMTTKILISVNQAGKTVQPVESIHQAISLLGKDKTIALVLQSAFEQAYKTIDLSAYNSNKTKFFEVSMLRMELVYNWFKKVSIGHLPIITTAALLGNLGELIIASLAHDRDIKYKFLSLIEETNNPTMVEVEFFNTTSEDVSAEILAHWHLDQRLIDAIKYSNDLALAPDNVKQLAIACFVAFNTVPLLTPKIDLERVAEMADFLKEMDFEPQHYLDAVENLQK